MKRFFILLTAIIMILAMATAAAETAGKTLMPLPDTTMEALDDSIVAVSLEKGGAYLNDHGMLCMMLSVYTYDKYDPVDVSMLEAGDTILFCGEDIAVTKVEINETGTVLINGGRDEGGLDLVTFDDGVYFAMDYSDAKYWYLAGYAEYPVSTEFTYTDSSDLDKPEPVVYYPGDFLTEDAGIDYFFSPNDTTVRIEGGMIVEMIRVYAP